MTLDAAILAVVVAFLLPLRLLSLALRLATSRRGFNAQGLRRSCATLALTAALFAAIFALPCDRARECAAPAVVADGISDEGAIQGELRAEVEQLKLQLARLESLWGNNSKVLDGKGDALEEKDARVVRALGLDVQSLIDAQENIKESLCSSYGDSIKAMENEVRNLKDESRKMNFDIHNVQSLAKDTGERVEALHSDIKKILTGQVLRALFDNIHGWISCRVSGTVQVIIDEWGKMNSNINRVWSFAKDTEKRVEDLYSDIKKGFKRTKRKMPFWTDW